MLDYYKHELNSLNKRDINITFQVRAGNTQTKWLNLNANSLKALTEFFNNQ